MDEVIDIYTKLIIAIISFIAPLIVYLLSNFSDGIEAAKEKYQEGVKQLDILIRTGVTNDNEDFGDVLSASHDQLMAKKKGYKRRLRLLNPRRQISRIFPTLFASLLLVMIYHLCVVQCWHDGLKISLLLLSLFFAVLGGVFLKNVAWELIKVKEEVAEARAKENRERKDPGTGKIHPAT